MLPLPVGGGHPVILWGATAGLDLRLHRALKDCTQCSSDASKGHCCWMHSAAGATAIAHAFSLEGYGGLFGILGEVAAGIALSSSNRI